MTRPWAALAVAAPIVLGAPSGAKGDDFVADPYAVSVQSDLTDGQGVVGALLPRAMVRDPAVTARADGVRDRTGLTPLDDRTREQLWNTSFAAARDLTGAVAYGRRHADELGLDPERNAIGGFSAGAVAAINAAYGMDVGREAVFSLSGGIAGYDLRKTVRPGMPPGLFIVGHNDLEGMPLGTRTALEVLGAAGIETEAAWMPGFGHFDPMGVTSLGTNLSKQTFEPRILRFPDWSLGVER